MSADTLMAWHAQTLSRVPQRDGGRACCQRRGLPFGAAFANSCRAWPLPIEVLQCLSFSLPCSARESLVWSGIPVRLRRKILFPQKKPVLRLTAGGVRGCFHVEVVSFSRRIVSSRIPFVSCLYSIVFQNMKNTVRIQSTRYVLTHALYHHFSNTV
jgi:hypothetical protein